MKLDGPFDHHRGMDRSEMCDISKQPSPLCIKGENTMGQWHPAVCNGYLPSLLTHHGMLYLLATHETFLEVDGRRDSVGAVSG